ncbi:hypothetical protein [Hymenobacter metallilatus]|uniref:Lipoprotein n=1 Tax=Hymenobacter metallilatus TaxID=2493666 RepID=A0A3R9MAX3_9BACT|nr:hypothetical protein [Hymenobacter metallilatus]RSK37497.1 hypothetical protein EI290_02270 [Hymenobacter metallilatus]
MLNQMWAAMLCLLVGGCTSSVSETPWVTLKVDEQVTVQLPAQPQKLSAPDVLSALHPQREQDTQVKATQVYKLEDTSAVYVVIRIPTAEAPVLPPTFEERKSYYLNRMIPLMLGREYPNLLEQSVTEQDGVDMVTVKHKAFTVDSAVVIKYVRSCIVGRTVYQFHFLPLRQTGDFKEAERLRFFNSAQVQQPAAK